MVNKVREGDQLVLAIYVKDIRRSSRFFLDFGFEVSRDEGTFMELKWEESLLFLVQMENQLVPRAPVGNLRVLVQDVDGYWQKAQELGYPVVTSIGDRYYGLRDFVVEGPDGINLRFASWLKT